MKHELYFEHVITIGNLYLEHIFLQFEMEPVFFTCVDEKDNLFICLCSDIRGGQKWIISECSLYTLDRLITGTMDISSSLCIPEHLVLITRDLQGHEKSCMINTCDVDPLDLPKAGTLLKCDIESANAYFMVKKSGDFILNVEYVSPIVNRLLAYSTRLHEMVVHESELVESEKHSVSEQEPHTHTIDYHNLDDVNTELYLSAA